MKRWMCKCEVNLCADKVIGACVSANTKRKAIAKAIELLTKQGYFSIKILSCEEMKKHDNPTDESSGS